jgi:hypothetical protein
MGAIKITPADSALSLCVRERAAWKCERCGSTPDRRGLHASHFHGRGKWSVRFNPLNLTSLCHGCHSYFGARPVEHMEWQRNKLGQYLFEALQEAANDLSRGRQAKREVKLIAAHYKAEHARMQLERADGFQGRIEFMGY